VEWLEDHVEDRQRLFSDSAQDAREENRRRRTAKNVKATLYSKIAEDIFSVDEDVKFRDDLRAHGVKRYAKAIENRIARWANPIFAATQCWFRQPSLKVKYREINVELGRTGAGLAIEDIMAQPLHKDRLGV
jgi:hypothetical protein